MQHRGFSAQLFAAKSPMIPVAIPLLAVQAPTDIPWLSVHMSNSLRSAVGPGCVKTRIERAPAQQWTRQLRTRESLLLATAVSRINAARSGLKNSFYTAWVTSRRKSAAGATSAFRGRADEIRRKADIAAELPVLRAEQTIAVMVLHSCL